MSRSWHSATKNRSNQLWPPCIALLVFFLQQAPLQPMPLSRGEDCISQLGYRAMFQAGSESGGQRNEKRDQNRARVLHRLALAGECKFADSWPAMGALLEWSGFHDYHYFNAEEDRHDDLQYLSRAYAFLGSSSAIVAKDKADTLPGHNLYSQVLIMPPLDVPSQDLVAEGAGLLLGRADWQLDAEGLVYAGQGPLALAGINLNYPRSGIAQTIRFGGAALERQLRVRRGLPDSKLSPDRLYMLMTGLNFNNFNINLAYLFYRAPGRTAQPDWIIRGPLHNQYKLPTGQSARPDLDVHYYGLQVAHSLTSWGWSANLWHNYGRQIAVAADGTRVGSSRKSIQGSLASIKFYYQFGEISLAWSCTSRQLKQSDCRKFQKQSSLAAIHQIGLEALYATRDRDKSDTRLNGFGSLQPAPQILGGAASIYLQGPPPATERTWQINQEPYQLFSDGGLLPYTEPGNIRDNSDPAPPDFANDGMKIGGLHYRYLLQTKNKLPGRIDLHWNYADLRFGDGQEWIIKYTGAMFAGSTSLAGAYLWSDSSLLWSFSITGATYTPHEREYNEWTGLSRKSPTRFYSRYLLSLGLRF